MRNKIASLVEEMHYHFYRSGYSTIIRESRDFSCVILDREGGLVVAHPSTTAWRFDHLGRPTHHVDAGDDIFCTNIAFAGPDLYLVVSRPSSKVAGGTILKATMPVAGKAMYSHT